MTNTRVTRLLVDGGKAVGVEAESSVGRLNIHARTVVLSDGGKANPLILQRAGLDKAGLGFFYEWGRAGDRLKRDFGYYQESR